MLRAPLLARVDLAQPWIAELGVEYFRTCWPQTMLQFLGAAASGEERPFVAVGLKTAESPNHEGNTTYTSYYYLKTAVVDLLRTAWALSGHVSADTVDAAVAHILEPQRYKDSIRVTLLFGAYDDTRQDSRMASQLCREAMNEAQGVAKKRLRVLWLASILPRWAKALAFWCFVALRNSPADASRAIGEWKVNAGQRRDRRFATSGTKSRTYGPKDF